ncbi:MAG: carbon-nitrogen hydrolase family protein [Prosthecobacter sp.]|nr:carbon-nitrogen hydrolase family protein [Prosthecobacter sp.]
MNYRAALIQMQVRGGDLQGNLARAEMQIEQAARAGAKLAILPETMDLGWTHPSARELAAPIPGGEAAERLCAAAARHQIHVCAGLTERAESGIYNAAVIIDSHGRILIKHRKINELSIAHDCYAQGDRLNVVDTELGRLGLMICADAFAEGQVLSRSLGCMGAEVILSPAAWAVPSDHDQTADPYGRVWCDAYLPVARAFGVWIIGVSNVGPITAGPWAGRKCIGCSLVIDPTGQEVLQAPYGETAETLLLTEIQLNPARPRAVHDL